MSTDEDWEQRYKDLKQEFDDFQEGSAELEKELEKEVAQAGKKLKDAQNEASRLREELETAKEKIKRATDESIKLREELNTAQALSESYRLKFRSLEQQNDDLERNLRVAEGTISNLESQLIVASEKNALHEAELEENELRANDMQRLKDEIRDLQLELDVIARRAESQPTQHQDTNAPKTPMRPTKTNDDAVIWSPRTPVQTSIEALPPSTPGHINTMALVSDLMSRAALLHQRLSECNNLASPIRRASKIPK